MSTSFRNDVISSLFDLDLDVPLQTIFLFLDPLHLKKSRLVCQQWSNFIKKRVWGCDPGTQPYVELRKRLMFQWKKTTPTPRTLALDQEVNCVSCDDSIVVCGMKTGIAKIYDITCINDWSFIKDLDCTPAQSFAGAILSKITNRSGVGEVQSDIGKEIVVTISDKGDVSVWKRSDWSNLYKESHHGSREVYAVKVLPNMVITGGCDGRLAILSWDGEHVEFMRFLGEDPPSSMPKFETPMDNPWHITHLDSDGKWVLVATSMCLKVWNIEDDTLVNTIETAWTNSLAMSYPFGIIAQNTKGLNVLNLETGKPARMVKTNMFWQVARNGPLLVGSTPNLPWEATNRQSVTVHNFSEVVEGGREEKWGRKEDVSAWNVWKRTKYLASGQKMSSSCINSSCLVTAQGNQVNLWDFWNCDSFNDLESWARTTVA